MENKTTTEEGIAEHLMSRPKMCCCALETKLILHIKREKLPLKHKTVSLLYAH